MPKSHLAIFTVLLMLASTLVAASPSKFALNRLDAQFLVVGNDGPFLMDKTAETGVSMILIRAHWSFIEPSPPTGGFSSTPGQLAGIHTYDWSLVDNAVDLAQARGLAVALQLTKAPDWATGAPAGCGGDLSESNDACGRITVAKKELFRRSYEDFAYHATMNFPNIDHFVLWNEPNLRPNFNPDSFSNIVNEYMELVYFRGHNGVKSARSTAKVGGSELTTLNTFWGNWRHNGVDPMLRFFGSLYDFFTIHSYNGSGFQTLLKMSDLNSEISEHSYGGAVWLTEFNFDDGTCSNSDLFIANQTETVFNNMWWDKSFFFNLTDLPSAPCGFGLLRGSSFGFADKPLFQLFKDIVTN